MSAEDEKEPIDTGRYTKKFMRVIRRAMEAWTPKAHELPAATSVIVSSKLMQAISGRKDISVYGEEGVQYFCQQNLPALCFIVPHGPVMLHYEIDQYANYFTRIKETVNPLALSERLLEVVDHEKEEGSPFPVDQDGDTLPIKQVTFADNGAFDRFGHQAMRHNEGKLRWSLVDFTCFEDMVRVLEAGTKKYSEDNWKRGLPMKAQCDSMMRHLIALMSGELNDPETGLPHIGHIQCNAMFMAHTMKDHPQLNNLPKQS